MESVDYLAIKISFLIQYTHAPISLICDCLEDGHYSLAIVFSLYFLLGAIVLSWSSLCIDASTINSALYL